MLRKYVTLVKQSFLATISYRAEMSLWMVLDIFPLLIMIFIWSSIYSQQSEFSGYTLQAILQYFFLTTVINGTTGSHFESRRVQEIRDGKIDFFLIRPLGYIGELFFNSLGNRLFYLFLSLPVFVAVFMLLGHTRGVTLPEATVFQWSLFVLFLCTSYMIEFLLATIIVLAGFWQEYSEGLEHFKWIIISLFSGWIIPLPLMPSWLRSITETLPFKYMHAVPIGIVQQTQQAQLSDAAYLVLFIGGLAVVVKLLWTRAQYKYSSQGG